jgi:hypothetical protein
MPRISEFFGIVIRMFYNDHWPPHFHAEMTSMKLCTGLRPLRCCEVDLPVALTLWL